MSEKEREQLILALYDVVKWCPDHLEYVIPFCQLMTAEGRSEGIKELLDCSMTLHTQTYDTLCKVYPLEWLTKWSSTGKSHIRFPGKGI